MFVYTCKDGEGLFLTEDGRDPIAIFPVQKSTKTPIAIAIQASKSVDIIPTKKLACPRVKHSNQKDHHEDVQKI